MVKLHKNPFFSLHILLFFLQFTLLLSQTPDFGILNCLKNKKISNFTLHPTSNHHSSVHYNHFLKFSLQNLVISGDSIPKPTAIILPDTKDHLVDSVLCCRSSSLEIRIRCGGHSYAGLSSIPRGNNPFIIIDMMNINRVIVDLESETAWVEGGATVGELHSAIAAHSSYYGFPTGVGSTVGVSGHFSGGGIGVLSRKYGLSADNVLDVGLIDAEGRVLDRAQMGEEVFWALRGSGGGNWGVVYGWKVQLVHVPNKVTCFALTKKGPTHELAQLIYKWQLVAPYLDDGFHISVYVTASPTKEVYVTFKGFYLGGKNEAISIINQHFNELKLCEDNYVEMSWIESVLYNSGLPKGSTTHDLKSRYWSTKLYMKSDYVKEPISIAGIENALEIAALEPKGLMLLDPCGGIMDRISNDSIAFPHRKGNMYNILYALLWEEEDDENRCLNWIRRIYDYMTPFVSSKPRASYVNYVDLDLGSIDYRDDKDNIVEKSRVWGEKYFLGNYDRLVRVKTIIDRENIFSHQQGIPPLKTTHNEL